jgi:tripartite-type tricarboxylate transporter receptor subunit TctC
MTHVPYKGGGPAAAAVLAGEAQVLFGSVASAMPHVKSGRLKALATTGHQRSKVAPDVPTMTEAGVSGVEVTSWYSLMVPAGTPAPIVKRIRDDTITALGAQDVQQAMGRQGLDAETSTPQELAERIASETRTWSDVIRAAGIKAE